MELLLYFSERPGRIVSKKELLEQVWRAHVVDEAVHRAVSILRSALGDTSHHSTIIETVPRHGYRLLVRPVALDPRGPWSRYRAPVIAVAAATAAAIGLVVIAPTRLPTPSPPPTRAIAVPIEAAIPSAVMPAQPSAARPAASQRKRPVGPNAKPAPLTPQARRSIDQPVASAIAPPAPAATARENQPTPPPTPLAEAPVAKQPTPEPIGR